jgi:predicted negative regulator of RcsB-dependent stress response
MPIIDAFIVAAIVTVFLIFGVVLAWAEYQTRHLPQAVQQSAAGAKHEAAAIHAKAA